MTPLQSIKNIESTTITTLKLVILGCISMVGGPRRRYSQLCPYFWRCEWTVVRVGIKTSHRTGVEAVVCTILPELGPIGVWCCDAEESEEGNSQRELNGDESIEWPFVRAVSPREKHICDSIV